MRLVNMLRIFCYLGLPLGCGTAPMAMAQHSVHVDETLTQPPFTQSSLELALVPRTRSQAAVLSTVTKPMTMPFIVGIPKGATRASMLQLVAKSNAQHAMSAQAVMAMASATTQCVTLTYDQNGNRLSQAVTSIAAAPVTWGSGVYGCFVWAP